MANPSVETVNTSGDKLMLALGVLLVLAGFVRSAPGKSRIALAKDSYKEVRKVVWPTRKEATQTTLVVFGFVLVMAIFLWLSDKSIEWVIFSAILGWK
jgi:preprotein translocase subunit SecE